MAATTEVQNPAAQHYVDYEEYVDFQLEKTRSSIKLTDIFTTLTALAVVVITYLLFFVVFDQWVLEGGFGYAARVGLLSVLSAVVLGTLTWRVVLPLLRRIHPLYAARIIEKSDPKLKSNLVNFVDVRQSNMQSAPVVLKAMEKRAAVELSHIDVEEAVDRRPLLRIAYALLGVVVLGSLYILLSPKDVFTSVRRALLPTAAIDVATETTITEVDPNADSEVPAGTVLKVSAEVRGKEAENAQIVFTTADHKYVNQPVEMKRDQPTLPRFSGVLNGENGRGLLQSLKYRIVAGDARTKEYSVTVVQSPGARVDEVQYDYPPYMELANHMTQEGHIDGWEGTTITVRATANMAVKSAKIVLTDVEDAAVKGEEIGMLVTDGTKLSATWKLEFRSDGTSAHFYHIDVKTQNDQMGRDPTQFTYAIRPDRRPEVALLAPTGDLGMPPPVPPLPSNGIIPLIIHAADADFQLRSIALKAEKNGESILDQKLFEDQLPAPACQGKYDFSLAPLKLNDGETIQFWVEARDNKHPTANRAMTPRINVKVGKPVSAKEAQEQLAEEKKKQDQLAKIEGEQNPPRPDDPPAPKAGRNGEAAQPDKPQPRTERTKADDRRQPGDEAFEKDSQGQQEKAEQANEGTGRRKRPASPQEALQQLAQKERERKPADENSESESQPSPDEQNSADRSSDPTNRDQRENEREKTPGASPKNANNTGNDRTDQAGNAADQEKPQPGNPSDGESEDPSEKPQSKKDKTKRDKNDAQQPNQPGQNGNDKQPSKKADGDQEEGGGPGKAGDQKPGDKTDGDNVKKQGPGKQPRADGKPEENSAAPKPKDPSGKKPGEKGTGATDPSQPDSGTNNRKKPEDSGTGADPGNKEDPSKAGDHPEGSDANDDPSKAGSSGADPKESADSDGPPPSADPKDKSPGGAGKAEEKTDSAPNSKDPAGPKGTAGGDSENGQEDQQPGTGQGKPSKKTADGPPKPGRTNNPSAKEEPAEPSNDSVKKEATGDETGKGVGDEEGDPQAPKAKNDIQREEGSPPGKKQTSPGKPDAAAKKADGKRPPEDGTPGSSPNPERAKRPGDSKDEKHPSERVDDQDTDSAPNDKERKQSDGRPDNPPQNASEELKGPGRPNGQRSHQPQNGEEGSSAPNEDGRRGANKTGRGDKTDEAGETDPAKEKTGVSGKEKGPGSKTRPTNEQGQPDSSPGEESGTEPAKSGQGKSSRKPGKSGEAGQPGEKSDGPSSKPSNGRDGQPDDGKTGGKPGENGGKPGAGQKPGSKSPAGKPAGQSAQPGRPSSNPGSAPSGSGITGRPEDGEGAADGKGGPSDAAREKPGDAADDDEPPTPEEEEAHLEYARKATNLVLNRLKDQLRRGEVDQKLLDELGWKDQKDVERLVKFLEQGLNPRDDDTSPEAINRQQQFEETLKSLRLGDETGTRTGSAGTSRQTRQNAVRSIPVPPEYRKAYESYTRSMSKNVDSSGEKANPGKAKKTK